MPSVAQRSDPSPGWHNVGLLREAVREAERVVEIQARAMEELDDKSEHLVNLAVAAMAGSVTLALFALTNANAWPWVAPMAPLLVGSAYNVAALWRFLAAYNARHARDASVEVGPDLKWVEGRLDQPRWGLREHLRHVVAGYAAYQRANQETMSVTARDRSRGLAFLFVALAAYGLAFVLIAGMRIWS